MGCQYRPALFLVYGQRVRISRSAEATSTKMHLKTSNSLIHRTWTKTPPSSHSSSNSLFPGTLSYPPGRVSCLPLPTPVLAVCSTQKSHYTATPPLLISQPAAPPDQLSVHCLPFHHDVHSLARYDRFRTEHLLMKMPFIENCVLRLDYKVHAAFWSYRKLIQFISAYLLPAQISLSFFSP